MSIHVEGYAVDPLHAPHRRYPERALKWVCETSTKRVWAWGDRTGSRLFPVVAVAAFVISIPVALVLLALNWIDYKITPFDSSDVEIAAGVTVLGLHVVVPVFRTVRETPAEKLIRAIEAWNAVAGFDGVRLEGEVIVVDASRTPAHKGRFLVVERRRKNYVSPGC